MVAMVVMALGCGYPVSHVHGQAVVADHPPKRVARLSKPSELTIGKERSLIRGVYDPELMNPSLFARSILSREWP